MTRFDDAKCENPLQHVLHTERCSYRTCLVEEYYLAVVSASSIVSLTTPDGSCCNFTHYHDTGPIINPTVMFGDRKGTNVGAAGGGGDVVTVAPAEALPPSAEASVVTATIAPSDLTDQQTYIH